MLRKLMIVLSGLRSLIIISNDGAPANEYRIEQRSVEFRTIAANGKLHASASKWRALNDDEIQLHFALRTPVADWLDKNLYPSARAA
jgi:hypothetical protein